MELALSHRRKHPVGLRPAYGSGEDWNSLLKGVEGASLEVAPGLRVGRGLEHPLLTALARHFLLRPAYGSGEDWNSINSRSIRANFPLRPAYGSGEDWNKTRAELEEEVRALRPAYGSGEDWNVQAGRSN